MNRIYKILLTTLMLLPSVFFAQQIANLEGINFQAVAIDTDGKEIVGKDVVGKPLYKKDIDVRYTITSGENGTIYYQETHSTTTNENGLFSLNIGLGEQTPDTDYSNLLDMPWINGDQWLQVEIALEDGEYELVSNTKFMAVPYTYYADDIADDAIRTEKILDFEILNQDMSTASVDTRVILDSTILNIDYSSQSVDTRVILDSTILNEDMSTGSVDSRVILDSTILNEDMSSESVDTRVIEDSTILNEDMSTASVDTRVIEDSTILNEDMSTASVDSRVIQNESILNEDIANGTIDLTTKVNGILPVENGGTERNNLTAERVLIGNGVNPIKTPPYPADSGQILTHINGVTEPYKMEAGTFMSIGYDDIAKTITFTADEQTIGETNAVGTNVNLGGNIAAGDQVEKSFPLASNVGDLILVGITDDPNGLTITGYVDAPNSITVIFYNGSNGPIAPPSNFALRVINLGQ